MVSSNRRLLLVLLCFQCSTLGFGSAPAATHVAYTDSCRQDTKWIRGPGGARVRSWLKSIVPIVKAKVKAEDAWMAIFHAKTNELLQVVSNRPSPKLQQEPFSLVSWRRAGGEENDMPGWLYDAFVGDGHGRLEPAAATDEGDGDGGGGGGGRTYFVYPDFSTALVGMFDKGLLVEGRETKVVAYRCHQRVIELRFASVDEAQPIYRYEEATDRFITSQPKLRDPLEKRNVYVSQTTLKGLKEDGLFAKRDLEPGALVCLLAGVRFPAGSTLHEQKYLAPNLTLDEQFLLQKNLLAAPGDMVVDVPSPWDDVVHYRATLGHKANHAFEDEANADYCNVYVPHFGLIQGIKSLRKIDRGQEIFVDYQVDMRMQKPKWFEDAWLKYQEKVSSQERSAHS